MVANNNEADRLPAHVTRVVAPNPGPMTLAGTNTWVIGVPSVAGGPDAPAGAWVIDPGPDDEGHLERVLREATRRGGLAGIALTHSHGDHVDGADRLAEMADGVVVRSRYPSAEAGPLRGFHTPGHAADHMIFLLGDICFTGDLVLGTGSTIVPPGDGGLAAYLDSLRLLERLGAAILCPGHGPPIFDPPAKIAEYVEHRMMRERLLLAALADGVRERSALLDRAWHDVAPALRPAAAMSLEAHLEKLADEGRLPDDID